jgi:hypothetical protein
MNLQCTINRDHVLTTCPNREGYVHNFDIGIIDTILNCCGEKLPSNNRANCSGCKEGECYLTREMYESAFKALPEEMQRHYNDLVGSC